MKKTGFPAVKAGAIEVAASVNGQIMPPIMGAAAFIIAEMLGITYFQVITHAFIPAFIVYLSLFWISDLEAAKLGLKGTLAFSGKLADDQIQGSVKNNVNEINAFQADRKKMNNQIDRKIEKSSDLSVFYPEGAYGLIKDHAKPNAILINDATLWTCGPKGTLAEWDILFVDGKIEQVAPDITVPKGSAVVLSLIHI